ncbi:MAG: hypothetical protein FWF83_01740 [Clostridiales bacterium]|nr:hypothetical protein [Clostridiales bacterium]
MKDLDQMLELLEGKKAYFLHYEKEMESMPLLPAEELDACVQRGAAIIKKIEELDGKLNLLLQQNGAMAASAVKHDCDRGQLPQELGMLYDASLGVKAVASRILQNDGMIRERIALERDKAMESIKEINQRASSVAGRYQRTTQAGAPTSFQGWMEREA